MRKDYKLEKRKYVIGSFIVVIVLIYLVRLFNLQVLDSSYKDEADSNAFLRKAIYPSRGIIYDRNGNVVVFNRPAYDIMMIPRDVQPFDTLDLCRTLGITPEKLRKRFSDMRDKRLNPGYSSYSPQVLMTHLSAEDYGRLQEKCIAIRDFSYKNEYCVNTTIIAGPTSSATYARCLKRILTMIPTIREVTTPATWEWKKL